MNKELTIVIPTYNERDNINPMLEKLNQALDGIDWNVIFVDDDSPDKTADLAREFAKDSEHISCIHRIGRRGLSSACIEGMLASHTEYIAVMDADLQHDEKILENMLETLKKDDLDIVIGSRYVDGGDSKSFSQWRNLISRGATKISRIIIRSEIKDPMSGFFMLKKEFFDRVVRDLSGKGFKILLDLFASSKETVRFKEIPYSFRLRHAGESKLDSMVILEYIHLIIEKLIGRFIPVRFVLFVLVGCFGAFGHLCVLAIFFKWFEFSFIFSQAAATFLAMTLNFVVNNIFTYRDKKLSGVSFYKGLVSFYIACTIGAIINLRIAYFLYDSNIQWWLAGLLGGVVGAVWNYSITSTFTWKKFRHNLTS